MFRIHFLKFFDHPVACYDFLNTLYSIVKLVPNFWNYAALCSIFTDRHNYRAESTLRLDTKQNTAFYLYYEAGHCIFSVLRSRKYILLQIPYRSVACITYIVNVYRIAFRSIMAAFRSVTMKRSTAQFKKSEVCLTKEYRVIKKI